MVSGRGGWSRIQVKEPILQFYLFFIPQKTSTEFKVTFFDQNNQPIQTEDLGQDQSKKIWIHR